MNKYMYAYLVIPLMYSLLHEVEFLRPKVCIFITLMNLYYKIVIHKDCLNFTREYVFQML